MANEKREERQALVTGAEPRLGLYTEAPSFITQVLYNNRAGI